ncbi:MAG: zinc-ribbon domain-containing protein [Nitrososphaerota archaeon]|jgi:uncharacterized membrane protein YvbJ|nr:zinc-ribbon domain-containing protein [Nitrososphaerota archaeon]
MPYCRKCGAPLEEHIRFCPKCGTPVVIIRTASITPVPVRREPTGLLVIGLVIILVLTVAIVFFLLIQISNQWNFNTQHQVRASNKQPLNNFEAINVNIERSALKQCRVEQNICC